MAKERQGTDPSEPPCFAPSGCGLCVILGCVLWVAAVVVIWIRCLLYPVKEDVIPVFFMVVFLAILALPVCYLTTAIFIILFRALFNLFKR